jgi:WD40 repeat protein
LNLESRGWQDEIFDQDFLVDNHNVLLAGGRRGRVLIVDLRAESWEWEEIPHGRPVTHIRSINPHQVVVSGLRSSMGIYDLRFRKSGPNGTTPLLTFPQYRNDAHIHIGWDVDVSTGVIAAAHDDSTVALYSLHSGKNIQAPFIDGIHASSPIKALSFATLPRNQNPSLFVGQGSALRKYSFGMMKEDDDC